MPELAAEIRSNFRRTTTSWHDELSISPAQERILREADLRTADTPTSTHALELGAEMLERMTAARRGARWKGQERWQGKEAEEMRLVRIMHPHRIFERLRRAGVDARIESPEVTLPMVGRDGTVSLHRVLRSTGRLWMNENSVRGRIGVNAWINDPDTGRRIVRTVTTLQYPVGPEWSVMRFDQFDVPTEEKYRGWRTAMLHLILAGVVTEREVDRAFGPVVLNEASLLYRQELQMFRAQSAGLTPPPEKEVA